MTGDIKAETVANPSPSIFRNRDYMAYWIARVILSMGVGIESVTLGWHVYNIARLTRDVAESAFLVGMIGLVQFLPMFALALPAGEMVDRYNRKAIMIACTATNIACAVLFTLLSLEHVTVLWPIFAVSALFGVTRAFMMPVAGALGPMLVPRDQLPRAIAWNAIGMQVGRIVGPLVGGILCGLSVPLSFGVAGALYIVGTLAALRIRANTQPNNKGGSRWLLIREGLSYVWNNKIVFGAISLDLFAVLLGGATALLPVFARDVLFADATGFGLLRAGPFVGAAVMMLYLARYPLQRRAGATMFIAVGIFGLATLVFGLSRNLYLSVAALAILGAADAISVFVRQSLVQIATPDEMRGRVAAVSGLFISASNELGEFESGVVARLLGPVGAALFGGIGSLAVTGLWAKWFPQLRQADRLVD